MEIKEVGVEMEEVGVEMGEVDVEMEEVGVEMGEVGAETGEVVVEIRQGLYITSQSRRHSDLQRPLIHIIIWRLWGCDSRQCPRQRPPAASVSDTNH